MSSQLTVQWNYIIHFHIQGSWQLSALFPKECGRNCKCTRFVCFDRWLRRYDLITKYYYIIEKVYFIHKFYSKVFYIIYQHTVILAVFILSCRYKRDFLYVINTIKKHQTLSYLVRTYDTKKVQYEPCPHQPPTPTLVHYS